MNELFKILCGLDRESRNIIIESLDPQIASIVIQEIDMILRPPISTSYKRPPTRTSRLTGNGPTKDEIMKSKIEYAQRMAQKTVGRRKKVKKAVSTVLNHSNPFLALRAHGKVDGNVPERTAHAIGTGLNPIKMARDKLATVADPQGTAAQRALYRVAYPYSAVTEPLKKVIGRRLLK